MSQTPVRNIRISDHLWQQVNEAARNNDESAASFIRRALTVALKEHK